MNFKLIKTKQFSFTDASGTTVNAANHIVAYKGRVFALSTLNFTEEEFSIDGNVLKLKVECEVVKEPYTNNLGETVTALKIMPKMDLVLSSF